MDWKNIQNFIDAQDALLRERYPYTDEEKRVYSHMVKLAEEVGELSSEVLAVYKKQRDDKLETSHQERVSDELGDVLIVLLLIAKILHIDPERALIEKIRKIEQRNQG